MSLPHTHTHTQTEAIASVGGSSQPDTVSSQVTRRSPSPSLSEHSVNGDQSEPNPPRSAAGPPSRNSATSGDQSDIELSTLLPSRPEAVVLRDSARDATAANADLESQTEATHGQGQSEVRYRLGAAIRYLNPSHRERVLPEEHPSKKRIIFTGLVATTFAGLTVGLVVEGAKPNGAFHQV